MYLYQSVWFLWTSTPLAFMCLLVRLVFVSCAFRWICCSPRLLTDSTPHWSPIKPSSAAGTACKGFALRLPVIAHQALCSLTLSLCVRWTHSSYYTICKALHQWGTYLQTEPQIIFGISNTEAQSRHRAAGLSAESASVYLNTQIMPDAGAIWEVKFIICFLKVASSSFSISDCTVTPSIQAPDTAEDKGGDYFYRISN